MSSLFWTNDKKTFVDDAGMRMKVSDIIKTFRQNDVDVNVLATPLRMPRVPRLAPVATVNVSTPPVWRRVLMFLVFVSVVPVVLLAKL